MSKLLKNYTTTKKGNISKIRIDIAREDGKFQIDSKGIAKMVKEAHDATKTKTDDFVIFVKLFGATRPYTFNVDDTGNLIDYLDDYFDGTVKDTQKLTRSGLVQIYIRRYD